MQTCLFVREGTLRPLKELLDQFVFEGVLVSDNTCDFASPLVIVQKKEGGMGRMAVDYREVNLQLYGTANQLPYQPMLFQKLGGQKYFAKVDNSSSVALGEGKLEGYGYHHTMGCLPFPGLSI